MAKFNHDADEIYEALGFSNQHEFEQWFESEFMSINSGDPQNLTDEQLFAIAIGLENVLSDFLVVANAEIVEPIINMATRSQIIEILFETLKEDPIFRAYALGFIFTRMECPKFLAQDLFGE